MYLEQLDGKGDILCTTDLAARVHAQLGVTNIYLRPVRLIRTIRTMYLKASLNNTQKRKQRSPKRTDGAETELGREHRTNGGAAGAVVTDNKLLKWDVVLLGDLTQHNSRRSSGGIALFDFKVGCNHALVYE